MDAATDGRSLAAAVATRQAEIGDVLDGLGATEFRGASRLPGWDRLTIACHLRYGAFASSRLTRAALAGRPGAFYPEGRHHQRPTTLRPRAGESAGEVIASLGQECRRLDDLWRTVDDPTWARAVDEPDDNPDLGSVSLWTLALLRLTEVEVHGHDLDLGLSPWSTTFVSAALPMRLRWLPTRRSNHRSADHTINGRWTLINTDGQSFIVQATGSTVDVVAVEVEAGADAGRGAEVALVGSGSQLLAFLLGRLALGDLEVRGDQDLARSFHRAFPGP